MLSLITFPNRKLRTIMMFVSLFKKSKKRQPDLLSGFLRF